MTNRVEYNVRRGDSPDGREVRTGRTRLCISDTWFNNRIFIGILYFYPFSRAVAPIAYAGYLFLDPPPQTLARIIDGDDHRRPARLIPFITDYIL